jgi:DNA-directed RNA polymerase specialized sigma24 family protein
VWARLTGRLGLHIVPKAHVEDTQNLVRQTIQSETAAWRALQALLTPTIVRIARRHRSMRLKGLADRDDDIEDVRTAALERLAANGFHNLRNFADRHQATGDSESFDGWLYGVVDFAIRDHLRKRFGRAPKVHGAPGAAFNPANGICSLRLAD